MNQMLTALLFVVCITFVAAFALPVDASIVASWDLSGDAGDQVSEPAAFSAGGVIGAAIIRGTGLDAVAGADSFNSDDWDDNTADEYIQFGFTVQPGFVVDLANLTLATRSSATGPGMMDLFTSIDGYATAVFTFDQSPGNNFVNTIVDLSSLPVLTAGAFSVRLIEVGNTQADGVGATGSTGTFRIAEYDTGGVGPLDVQFNGVVQQVPELGGVVVWVTLLGAAAVGWRRWTET